MLHLCGFAGAGMPNNTNKFTTVDLKRNIFQRYVLKGRTDTIDMVQIFHL